MATFAYPVVMKGGHHGVELWVATKRPYAHIGGRPQYFEKRHAVVLHAHPRCLITRLTTDWIDCICVVLHAPQSGRPYHECEEWWQSTTMKVQAFSDLAPLYVMLDANATTGPCDDCTIFDHDDATSKHTELFREFLRVLNLYAPSTTEVHYGPDATWTSPDGSYSRRIDYVLVPQHQYSHCVFSGPLQELDLGNGDTDHVATGVQMEWSTETHKHTKAHDHTIPSWSTVDDGKLHQELRQFQAESWTCDIETQVQHFNRHVHTALRSAARRARTQGPKKPYIDDDTWKLRNDKNNLKRRLRRIGARSATDVYFAVFKAWKSLDATGLGLEHRTTLLCKSFKLRIEINIIAKRLQKRLRCAKQAHVQSVFEQMPDTHSASQILKELRPIIGSSNMRKRGMPALPQVVNEQGEVCTSIEASRDRWIRFFSHMEGGQRVSGAQQRQLWRQGLNQIQADSLDEPLQRVPSLFDLEVSLRRVQPGKAVGRDAIPPELCHRFPGLLGPQIYPQLLKLCCHGAEALEHKGGRLAVAYKR